VYGAQRNEETAGALRLLTDDPVAQKDAFVEVVRLEPRGAERGEDRVAPVERVRAIGRGADAQIGAVGVDGAFGDAPHDLQQLRAQAVEDGL
jgi:hypothetical protein